MEDLALLVQVAYLPGQPEGGLLLLERLEVSAQSTMRVGNHANRGQLLRQIPDLLRDLALSGGAAHEDLITDCYVLINNSDIAKRARLIRKRSHSTEIVRA
jgi:hypothetical protein